MQVSKDLAAAEASLTARDFAQASSHLHTAEVRLEQAGIQTGPLLAQADTVAREWSAKTKAQARFERFRQVHNRLHSSLREERPETLHECIESLQEYGVLDGRWQDHPDFRHLTKEQVEQLQQDFAESLFLAGWLGIQISVDDPVEEKQAAHRQAIDYWNRITSFHKRPIPALYLWTADAWDMLEEQELAASAREKATEHEDRTFLDYYVRGSR